MLFYIVLLIRILCVGKVLTFHIFKVHVIMTYAMFAVTGGGEGDN